MYQSVDKIVEYIEKNIQERVSLDELAQLSNVSKYHLARIFKNMTNQTVINYVRARKLTYSLVDLVNTQMRIIDISEKYRFEHEQTYIRAFKKQFGVTPSRYRKEPHTVKIVDKINLKCSVKINKGMLFLPQIVMRPAMKLVGIKHWVRNKENETDNIANKYGVEFFHKSINKIKNVVYPQIYIGLWIIQNNNKVGSHYMPSVEVSSFEDIPQGLSGETIPACRYAVFSYYGKHAKEEIGLETLQEIYHYIFYMWMPNYVTHDKGQILLKRPFQFEEIDARICDETYCEAKLYFPIEFVE